MKFLPLFALLAIGGCPVTLWADLKANDPAPPLAQSQIITVYRGEATPIPLQAQGRLAKDARFLLRSQPKLGKLSEILPGTPGSATILYEHEDANGTGTDSFTYAAQAPGSPVSAPARIRIRIVERPASFLTPERLEFNPVLVGQSDERKLTLENTGGGIVQGDIRVPAPWKIVGATTYNLSRGDTATFRLTFSPTDERDFVGKVTFSHDSKAETFLHGEGVFPLRVSPNTLDLQHPARSADKSAASVMVANTQDQAVTVTVQAPPFIEAPATLEIPARGQAELTIRSRPEILIGGEGKVILSEANGRAEIAVRVFPAPADIVTEPATTFHLGKVEAGESLRGKFRVSNQGGSTSEIEIDTPPSMTLATPRTITLAPGQKQEVRFIFEPNKVGDYAESSTLEFQGKTRTLAFTAHVESKGSLPTNRPSELSPETLPTPEAAPAPPTPFSFQKLFIASQTYHTVKIAWPKPTSEAPASYRVSHRKITTDAKGDIEELWEPMSGVIFGEEGGAVTAEITGLNANQRLSIRVFSLDAAGTITAVSSMFSITSKTYVPKEAPGWIWWIPVPFLIGGGIWFIRKRRQLIRQQDLARLEEITRI